MISAQDLWSRDKANIEAIKVDIINYVNGLQQTPGDFWKLNFMHSLILILGGQDNEAMHKLLKPLRDELFNYVSDKSTVKRKIKKDKRMDALRAAVEAHESDTR